MGRLTNKDGTYSRYLFEGDCVYGEEKMNNSLTQKLAQFEDIEEEVGIDLIALLTSKHIYYKLYCSGEKLSETYESYDFDINFNSKTINVYVCEDATPYVYLFSEYGKTWALNKEKLE